MNPYPHPYSYPFPIPTYPNPNPNPNPNPKPNPNPNPNPSPNPTPNQVMPAGTFHYVYTVRRKLVVAGDFCNASGWRTRAASVALFGDDPAHNKGLDQIFNDGVVRVEAPKARALLAEGGALTAERRAYLEQLLAWAEALRAELPKGEGREATLKPKVEEALLDVRRALEILL